MTTVVTLHVRCDEYSEDFPHFTGYIPRVGDSVVYYSKMHDGRQYSGVVTSIHHRIEFEHQNDVRLFNTRQTIDITITEKRRLQ